MTSSGERVTGSRARFADLHRQETFLIPNAWDVGSAKILAALGFEAIATTSSGFAAALGRMDQQVTLDELVAHAAALAGAVGIPVSVDAEHGYPETAGGVGATFELLAATGVAGASIEDYQPGVGLLPIDAAVARVAAAADVAGRHQVVLTARAENHLYGVDDLDDTIVRLRAYRAAGADVVFAPGLVDTGAIATVVAEVEAPVNVLLSPGGPTVPELAQVGVRRVSTGGSLAFAAYGTLAAGARELLATGTSAYTEGALSPADRTAAFKA